MKKYIIYTFLIFSGLLAFGQQEVMLSQYMFNGLFLNPAYSGSHKYFSSSLLHRNQWVGHTGAPKTFLLSVDGPFSDKRMGVGFVLSHDQIGVTRQSDFFANYAYRINFNSSSLAFGLKAGASFYSRADQELVVFDSQDNLISSQPIRMLLPKFGFGIYYNAESWYAGLSIPTMLAFQKGNNFSMDLTKGTFLAYHYFLTAGYVFNLKNDFKLKPSFLLKYVKNAPPEVDINLMAGYKDMVWLGMSYRSLDALIWIMEYRPTKRFRIGYSYDFTISPLRTYNFGSHEIMIGIDFGRDLVTIKTPRFF